jgi:ATP-dependent Clp protease ATP-binding subunit ClpA
MGLNLDAHTQEALALAKRSVPPDGQLDIGIMLAALYHGTPLSERLPGVVGSVLSEPSPLRESAEGKVSVAVPLAVVFAELARKGELVTPERFFRALIASNEGRQVLHSNGVGEERFKAIIAALDGVSGDGTGGEANSGSGPRGRDDIDPAWLLSQERKQAAQALSSWGRMLTDMDLPYKGVIGADRAIKDLRTTLLMMKNNVCIHGPAGCGKSAVVYEFARLLSTGDPSIDAQIADLDIFELSPTLLKAGASVVGEYEERVTALLKVLEAHPKIVLFVDELHSLLQSGMHHHDPFTQANQAFKVALGQGTISLIGCTTTDEFRHFIEEDEALKRRLGEVKLKEPTPKETLTILTARLPRVTAHYSGLSIPDEILDYAVELTEEYLPDLHQPAKSIRLLDRACAMSLVEGQTGVTEGMVFQALEATIGRSLIKPGELTEQGVLKQLKAKIVGQDQVIEELSSALVGGMGTWRKSEGPRGCWMFCGPTGVGKTMTAKLMAKILGGGERESLLRVDCNTLQGSGNDSGPAQNVLLGSPPGYRDHGPGVLSKIRDMPECIVLFDEIEKADPGVGQIIMGILDDGRVTDAMDAVLDFRRAFVVFTTNAGASYSGGRRRLGFDVTDTLADAEPPSVNADKVRDGLRATGHGEEFLGRNLRYFEFQGLTVEAARIIIGNLLNDQRAIAEERGYEFEWATELVEYLLAQWQSRFGARHLSRILSNRIEEHLSIGGAQGELEGVTRIRLEPMGEKPDPGRAGIATRERIDDTLVIKLA